MSILSLINYLKNLLRPLWTSRLFSFPFIFSIVGTSGVVVIWSGNQWIVMGRFGPMGMVFSGNIWPDKNRGKGLYALLECVGAGRVTAWSFPCHHLGTRLWQQLQRTSPPVGTVEQLVTWPRFLVLSFSNIWPSWAKVLSHRTHLLKTLLFLHPSYTSFY